MDTDSENTQQATPAGRTSIDLMQIANIFIRRFRMILAVIILSGLFGGLFISFQTDQYTATATIRLNTSEFQYVNLEAARGGYMEDSAAVQSELDIIKSRPLIKSVVKKLNLDEKHEFNRALAKPTLFSVVKSSIKDKLTGAESKSSGEATTDDLIQLKVVNEVYDRLSVRKDPLSYTVKISFTSEHPKLARKIANTVADEYLLYQIDQGTQASKDANIWLSERVKELKEQVRESELEVQKFIEEHELYELDGKTLNDQQISELNSELVMARTMHAQAEAKLNRAQQLLNNSSGVGSVKEVLDSALIQNLREEEAKLLREKSELSGHFGPKHPSMAKINSEIKDLREKIDFEIDKIIMGLENEVAISRVRINSLSGQLGGMRQKLGQSSELGIKLSELQREAQSDRALYESFLAQMKQAREAENLKQVKARFIARAETPLYPSYPNKKLILALFLFSGAFIGGFLALLCEYLGRGFLFPEHVEEHLGIVNIGMVPEVKKPKNAFSIYKIQQPSSVYAEALQNIVSSINFQNRRHPPRCIMTVSSQPQEGKGWLSISMARAVALSGKSVLLIDCDLNRPMISEYFNQEPRHTLNQFLSGEVALRKAVHADQKTGIHYIASSPDPKNKLKLLDSERMEKMIMAAKEKYDMVILDSPPVIGLSDVLVISKYADTAVMAIRWGLTSRHMVKKALQILSRAGVALTGTVLTRVPIKKYKDIEFGGVSSFKKYRGYYHEVKDEPRQDNKILKLVRR
jgi:capsular exopolysaccharide synthesis family protein